MSKRFLIAVRWSGFLPPTNPIPRALVAQQRIKSKFTQQPKAEHQLPVKIASASLNQATNAWHGQEFSLGNNVRNLLSDMAKSVMNNGHLRSE